MMNSGDHYFSITKLLLFAFFLLSPILNSDAQRSRMGKDSECYTANGRDYEGSQSTTYVPGDGAYEPTLPNIEDCLWWKNQDLDFNVTDREKTLPVNYCRNPNNRLFPWCYVMRGGAPTMAFCHIPTCSTPALIGCFKLFVGGSSPPPPGQNVTTTGPPPDLILDGEDSLTKDPDMKVGRCLNFCRSKKYNYAGVTGGDTCMCGKETTDGKQMNDVLNHLHPHDCLEQGCVGDSMQACGGHNAISIYDVEAGACSPPPIQNRDRGVIYSPRWPGDYVHELSCGWTVYVPDKYLKDEKTRKKHQMHVSFSYFNLEKENDTVKMYTYANATDGNAKLVAKYSGGETPAAIVLEVEEFFALHIVFNSDKDDKRDGFILLFNFTNRDGQIETTFPDVVITEPTTTPYRPTRLKTTTATTTTISKAPTTHRTTTVPVTKSTKATAKTSSATTKPGSTTTTTVNPNSSSTAKNATLVSGVKRAPSSLNGGQIAGIVIGVLVLLIIIILGGIAVMKYLRGDGSKESTPKPPDMFNNPVSFNADTNL